MSTVITHYYGDRRRSDEKSVKEEDKPAILARLRLLYEQGTPFFNQSTLREIVRQLDEHRSRACPPAYSNKRPGESESELDDMEDIWPVISIPTIDGKVLKTRLRTGLVRRGYKKNTKLVFMSPHIHYRTFQRLCDDLEDEVSVERAFCTTLLTYPMRQRCTRTGEFLDFWKRRPLWQVETTFKEVIRQWEETPDCRRLWDFMAAELPPGVHKIAVFGCNTMTAERTQKDSAYEHALVLTLIKILQHRRRSDDQPEIRCVTQESSYTDTDEEILGRHGITVVEDPRAFLEVDEHCVVLSLSPNDPVKQIIADIARPAAVIWSRISGKPEDSEVPRTDPESPRVCVMIRNEYDEGPTIGPEEIFWAYDPVVYIRRQQRPAEINGHLRLATRELGKNGCSVDD